MTSLSQAKAWRDEATTSIERIDEILLAASETDRESWRALRAACSRTQRVAEALVAVLEEKRVAS